jgi:hypothetical protein
MPDVQRAPSGEYGVSRLSLALRIGFQRAHMRCVFRCCAPSLPGRRAAQGRFAPFPFGAQLAFPGHGRFVSERRSERSTQ